jgi:4-hydroxybenzoate polyprenyltransferase
VRRTLRGLVVATHAGPTAVVTTYATTAAVASDVSAGRCVLLAVAVLLGQCSVGWANDWLDAPLDVRQRRPEKPVARGDLSAKLVRRAAFTALALCVPASLALGWRAGAAHLAAVAAAWSYDLGLKRTVASPAPYVVAFGLLPVFVAYAAPGAGGPAPGVVAMSALVGLAAHLANGVKDLDDDAATGVRGLPQRLGLLHSSVAGLGAVIAAGLVAVVSRPGAGSAVAAGLATALGVVAVLRARAGRSTGLFELSMAAAGPLVVAVVATGGVHG